MSNLPLPVHDHVYGWERNCPDCNPTVDYRDAPAKPPDTLEALRGEFVRLFGYIRENGPLPAAFPIMKGEWEAHESFCRRLLAALEEASVASLDGAADSIGLPVAQQEIARLRAELAAANAKIEAKDRALRVFLREFLVRPCPTGNDNACALGFDLLNHISMRDLRQAKAALSTTGDQK